MTWFLAAVALLLASGLASLFHRKGAVAAVIGPMDAVFRPAGHGIFRAMKFSTVEELVKVMRSAPSARKRAWLN